MEQTYIVITEYSFCLHQPIPFIYHSLETAKGNLNEAYTETLYELNYGIPKAILYHHPNETEWMECGEWPFENENERTI